MEQTSPLPTIATTNPVEHDDGASETLTEEQQRRKEFFARARERCGYEFKWFLKRVKQAPLVFETIDGPVQAKLCFFGVFHFDIQLQPKTKPIRLTKLKTFTISSAKDQEQLKEHIMIHKPTQAKGLIPQRGASRNPPIPDGLVEMAIQDKKQLALMLLNGMIVVGVPTVESVFSILLKVPDCDGKELLVFKHGLMGVRLYEEIKPE